VATAHEALGYRAKGLFTSLRTDWATPRQLFAMLDRHFRFTLDVCASVSNLPREGIEYFDPALTNALTRSWVPLTAGAVWCNPPYGRQIGRWIEKAFRESRRGTVVMLLPARTDTSWWHEYCMRGEVVFLQGRLCFDENPRKRAPFPSAIVVFRPPDFTAPESALRLL
jgi:site-specific DNA-methyltransferase (adenine-specific)